MRVIVYKCARVHGERKVTKNEILEKYDKSTYPCVLSIVDDKNLRAGTNRFNSVIISVIKENMKITILPNNFFLWTERLESAVFVFFFKRKENMQSKLLSTFITLY